jgi:hypothetical protein
MIQEEHYIDGIKISRLGANLIRCCECGLATPVLIGFRALKPQPKRRSQTEEIFVYFCPQHAPPLPDNPVVVTQTTTPEAPKPVQAIKPATKYFKRERKAKKNQ